MPMSDWMTPALFALGGTKQTEAEYARHTADLAGRFAGQRFIASPLARKNIEIS